MPMVDIDWLKEHVETPADLSVEQLSQDLVKVGLETETIHRSSVRGPLVVGKIIDHTPEPQKNGKTINWCHIDVGDKYNDTDEQGNKVPRGIICGAPNVRTGMLAVVALPGAELPGGFKIAVRKTYGHVSEGMCCAESEIGLSDAHNGIIDLEHQGFSAEEVEEIKPGEDAIHLLHLDIPILEINITPDRGYAFSYRGVAREYHHSTGEPYTDPVPILTRRAPEVKPGHMGDVPAAVEDSNPIHGNIGCDHYYLRVVRGFNPSAPTPNWMRRRLVRAGVRPHSLAVDVTNYVMLDVGQPMHAYDLDKVVPPIVVRRAGEGEKMTTLDGIERTLSHEDLVISDSPNGQRASRILGLAGDMGGQYGEITSETKNILIETAHFDPVTIARTARRHKLPTEASHRFERGTDTQMQAAAAQDAIEYLTRYGQGTASDNPTNIDTTVAPAPITFKTDWVKRLANLDCTPDEIASILTDIGCDVAGGGNGSFSVTPPTWRPDLRIPADLVEEVARIVGYDKIPVEIPKAPVKNTGLTLNQKRGRRVTDTLAQSGLVETISYPFIGSADFDAFRIDPSKIGSELVEITNPLAGDRPYMRTHVLYTLALTAQRNIRRGMENVQIYEIGHSFKARPNAPVIPALPGAHKPTAEQLKVLEEGLPDQPLQAAGILTGDAVNPGWYKDSRPIDWSDALARVNRIAGVLGAHLTFTALSDATNLPSDFVAASWHPGRTAVVSTDDGTYVGVAGELHPEVNKNLGFPDHSSAFEIDLTALFAALDTTPLKAKILSTFPPVREDLAFTVDESVTAAQLVAAIQEGAGADLESVRLFDVYRGKDLGEGKKSLAFSVVYRSASKTLKSSDAKQIRARVVASAAKLGAVLRV